MAGKGDTPRPKSVDEETFAANWDAIFKPRQQEPEQEDG